LACWARTQCASDSPFVPSISDWAWPPRSPESPTLWAAYPYPLLASMELDYFFPPVPPPTQVLHVPVQIIMRVPPILFWRLFFSVIPDFDGFLIPLNGLSPFFSFDFPPPMSTRLFLRPHNQIFFARSPFFPFPSDVLAGHSILSRRVTWIRFSITAFSF